MALWRGSHGSLRILAPGAISRHELLVAWSAHRVIELGLRSILTGCSQRAKAANAGSSPGNQSNFAFQPQHSLCPFLPKTIS